MLLWSLVSSSSSRRLHRRCGTLRPSPLLWSAISHEAMVALRCYYDIKPDKQTSKQEIEHDFLYHITDAKIQTIIMSHHTACRRKGECHYNIHISIKERLSPRQENSDKPTGRSRWMCTPTSQSMSSRQGQTSVLISKPFYLRAAGGIDKRTRAILRRTHCDDGTRAK